MERAVSQVLVGLAAPVVGRVEKGLQHLIGVDKDRPHLRIGTALDAGDGIGHVLLLP
ncbi:MAG: hypothetical protein K8R10_05450 [Rhodocyclales bacterium]|nr:hypothetical protein [Rhodocyclales bacterium]